MGSALRLGIAGLGTVGSGVVGIVRNRAAILEARTGREIVIAAVSARDRSKPRDFPPEDYTWVTDPVALAQSPDIDIFVELIGGTANPAKSAVEAALDAGKDVVTANKALLAMHGAELAERAEAKGHAIRFEAAVAGGIPVIKSLTEGLAANRITRVLGVMNGTCNYILTRMEDTGLPYETVFREAGSLGYLETDPTLDVGGIDASHKLAILSAIAFGGKPNFNGIKIEGIERVSIEDIRHAADMGYRIKLLGVARLTELGLEQRMQPCLVPISSPLGQLEGGTNMVVIEGDSVERIVLRGPGAGQGPTASAVMADICDLARGLKRPTFGQPSATLPELPKASAGLPAPYYLRMTLADRPGALATVAAALGNADISINRMRQYAHDRPEAPVLIVTHKATRAALDRALSTLEASDAVLTSPIVLRIENL